ncbi:MAG: hypothetical protein WCL56_00220 [Sediminibacterium sp.]|jgi:hypothetical protein
MKKNAAYLFAQHWDALIASVAAVLTIYYLTKFSGIGLSPDSIAYSTTAINLQAKGALVDFNNLPLVDFPAGYPFFLAFFSSIFHSNPITIAPILNSVLYVGVILMSSVLMQGFENSARWYRVAVLSLLATSPCLWDVYEMLWSETWFVFLVLLFMLVWRWYGKRQDIISLLVFAIIAALAFITRFAGITIVATGAALILFDGALSMVKKIKHLLLFVLMGVSLVVWNLLHNHYAAGSLAGVREKALRSIADNLLDIGTVIGSWLPFLNNRPLIGAIIFLLILLLAIIVVLYRLLQQQFYHRNKTVLALFFVVYAVFIIAAASISRFETLSSRLLSPIYIPFILVGSFWILRFIKQKTKLQKAGIVVLLICVYAATMFHQYQQNAENWEGIADAGIPGYAEAHWIASPLAKYIKEHKALFNQPVYSDANDGLYYLTGIQALPLPHKEIATEQIKLLQAPQLIVVWFNDGENPDLIDIPFIQAQKRLINTLHFNDGAIYFFSK